MRFLGLPVVLTLAWLSSWAPTAMAQTGPEPFAYFPSEGPDDARMLAFGCSGLGTVRVDSVNVTIDVPPGETSFTLSLFDGETSDGAAGAGNWDAGTRQLLYGLYRDPEKSANTAPADRVVVLEGNAVNPTSGPNFTADSATMPNNGWYNLTVTVDPLAMAPSGHHFYHLVIELDGACVPRERQLAGVKLALSAPASFALGRFGFDASLRSLFADGQIVFPAWDGTFPPTDPRLFLDTPTTYDGTFEFFLEVPAETTEIRLFDGDFDRGSNGGSAVPSGVAVAGCTDGNDADTPDDYSDFPGTFDLAGALGEGIRFPANPPDDTRVDLARRGEPGSADAIGCVRYEVIDPDGVVYRNDDPSGDREWEAFRIATRGAPDPNNADYGPAVAADGMTFVTADTLPAGIWRVRMVGLDQNSLSAVDLGNVCSVRADGPACPARRFVLGDAVFLDCNGDGSQGFGEAGIAGVVLNLRDGPGGTLIDTVVTGDVADPLFATCLVNNTGLGSGGLYCFGSDSPGTYTVEVDAANFEPGGALEGLVATTAGGNEQTAALVDDNVLTYDFGFNSPLVAGSTSWPEEPSGGSLAPVCLIIGALPPGSGN